MSTDGFVSEDDLILYAMQALSDPEMDEVASRIRQEPELAGRLAEIQAVLGTYASATVALDEVPASALNRLHRSIALERPAPVLQMPSSRKPSRVVDASRWSWNAGMLWAGWAVAAVLLAGVGLLMLRTRDAQSEAAAHSSGLQRLQTEVASLAMQRDQLRSSLQQQVAQLSAAQQEAAKAASRADQVTATSAQLSAKAAAADVQAKRASAQVDSLTATANETEAARRQLGEALSREQQLAASAADAQQVLAALADPSALHVTLTVPKEKKRPSGRGTYLASTGTLVFTGSDLASLPSDKVYELWLMPADGSAPIPAGTFSPDRSGNATLITRHFDRGAASGFAITIEKVGGSTTPTMPIVLAGNA